MPAALLSLAIYLSAPIFGRRLWGAVQEKDNNFFAHKIFFCATSTLFLLIWNTFSCNINTLLSKPNYFLCSVKLFISTQNDFSCNTKFLFWTSLRMKCHGDIFLLSHSNKNMISCHKINKLSFLCDTKKLI